jgi:hypothetical protein
MDKLFQKNTFQALLLAFFYFLLISLVLKQIAFQEAWTKIRGGEKNQETVDRFVYPFPFGTSMTMTQETNETGTRTRMNGLRNARGNC